MLLGSMREDTRNLPLTMLDKIALVQLERAMIQVWKTWKTYEFPKAVHIIDRWLKVELSAFYLEAVKDRLYCGDGHGVYFHLFNGLLQMLSPMVPLLVEEAWAYRPEWVQNDP
jgi:isoleucyl-tRNA synthetase